MKHNFLYLSIILLFVTSATANTINTGIWNGDTIRYYATEVALGLEKG